MCHQDYTHKKALGKFTAISFPTENDEGRASARGKGSKGMNNQIYSYLLISRFKHDPHNYILAQNVACIISLSVACSADCGLPP